MTEPGEPAAVVIGAGPGIGAAIARRLAADGRRVVLIARTAGRLAVLAATLRSSVPVTIRLADASNADGIADLIAAIRHDGPIGVVADLDIGRWVPHQARHSLATSLLRAGASLTHIRRYLGQVSEKMAEHYVHLTQTDLEDVLQHVWVAGPGAARPGELISGPAEPRCDGWFGSESFPVMAPRPREVSIHGRSRSQVACDLAGVA